ncbi:MAG: hypothetical protein B6245_20115 [Desulfobacteraceae bacterium 4572_88]|nr:MAG: hypothetical protein B6245_20115 [Desulfobacteraceae bacterium 4572_88]
MKLFRNVRDIAKKAGEKISGISDTTTLRDIARKTGFIKRNTGKISGEDFVRLMTAEILGEEAVSPEGLCDILRQTNPETDMSPQALNERMNRKEAVGYLREVFGPAL